MLMPRQWLQTDRQEPVYRDVSTRGVDVSLQMYDEAMGGIKKHLVSQTKKSRLIYTHELVPVQTSQTEQ